METVWAVWAPRRRPQRQRRQRRHAVLRRVTTADRPRRPTAAAERCAGGSWMKPASVGEPSAALHWRLPTMSTAASARRNPDRPHQALVGGPVRDGRLASASSDIACRPGRTVSRQRILVPAPWQQYLPVGPAEFWMTNTASVRPAKTIISPPLRRPSADGDLRSPSRARRALRWTAWLPATRLRRRSYSTVPPRHRMARPCHPTNQSARPKLEPRHIGRPAGRHA
jgi:hypothetical protein